MNKLEQATRQAIHKINQATALDEESDELLMEALTALREALAEQAEQEPVGHLCEASFGRGQVFWFNKPEDNAPLYAAPVRTKDLTDDEIEECVHIADSECTEDACMPWFIEFARAVIAAFKEKNK